MSDDLQEEYRLQACELADKKYGKATDFHSLPEEEQDELCSKAMELVNNDLYAVADFLRKGKEECA